MPLLQAAMMLRYEPGMSRSVTGFPQELNTSSCPLPNILLFVNHLVAGSVHLLLPTIVSTPPNPGTKRVEQWALVQTCIAEARPGHISAVQL